MEHIKTINAQQAKSTYAYKNTTEKTSWLENASRN
jgi:hypothetical protein